MEELVVARPRGRVLPHVDAYVGYRSVGVGPAEHRGLPSPWLTVVLALDEPLVVAEHPDPSQPGGTYAGLVGGLHLRPARITHDGSQSGVQLALSPLSARALLGVPAGELAGKDVHAEDLLGTWVRELQERMVEAPTWEGRFAVLDQLLAVRVQETDGPAPEVRRAWALLRSHGGGVRVEALAREVGWSARRRGDRIRPSRGSRHDGRLPGMTSPTDCWLTLSARDARGLIAFLVEAFGFRELAVHGDGDRVDHAELATPGGRGGIMLGSVRDGDERGVALPPGASTAYVVVPDVDALFARATAAGATVVSAPFDTDYGSRDCCLRDPEGGTWSFGTYAGEAA